jgi:hypothetical protein
VATAQPRSRVRWALVVLVIAMVILSLTSHHSSGGEPVSAGELTRVATQFNDDFQVNDVGPVWDRFDAQSQAVIPRARYLRWHQECPTSPGVATTLGVRRVSGGWWVMDYSIGGVVLHDYWHQVQGHWRFNLVRSNPSAVSLYSSNFTNYARASGCGAN